jgi:hypothetical protein
VLQEAHLVQHFNIGERRVGQSRLVELLMRNKMMNKKSQIKRGTTKNQKKETKRKKKKEKKKVTERGRFLSKNRSPNSFMMPQRPKIGAVIMAATSYTQRERKEQRKKTKGDLEDARRQRTNRKRSANIVIGQRFASQNAFKDRNQLELIVQSECRRGKDRSKKNQQ